MFDKKLLELIKQSGIFDRQWYEEHYGDVAAADMEPAVHYLKYGALLGRQPGPSFDTRYYLTSNPDVAKSGINPLVHYITSGKAEGRKPLPEVECKSQQLTVSKTEAFDPETKSGNNNQPNPDQTDYHLISKLFDRKFYLDKYPDVAAKGLDPVKHYLKYGSSEGRWPTPEFDTEFYRHTNPDIGNTNPFVHYVRYGKNEGRVSRAPQWGDKDQYSGLRSAKVVTKDIRCTILLPVYNAHDEVLECIHSVLRNTSIGQSNRLLILDDHSPDERVQQMLSDFADIMGVEIVYNETNLGYTANINKGCRRADNDDVVLLNSDTKVGPHWLRNLKQAAYQNEGIGSVTAVSNNAGAFSVPEPGTNILPEGIDDDTAARLVADTNPTTLFQVPTGNGFCLYIKRSLLSDIGLFDEVAFPRGYGEENDFCMRAIEAGWTNAVAANVYVAHARSASFGNAKTELMAAGRELVNERHPAYTGAIKAISASPVFKKARARVAESLGQTAKIGLARQPRILFVISTRTGGTPQTNRDLMEAVSDVYQCYTLACDRQKIELLEATQTGYRTLNTWHLAETITFATHVSLEYDEIMRSLLVDMSIDLLHIRHIAWHSLHLPRIAHGVGIPVVYSIHDFYTVCPSVNLIDEQGTLFLSGVYHDGANLLWKGDPTALPVTPSTLRQWQARMQDALSACDAFVTTCQSAKDIVNETLPAFYKRAEDFHVIPHGRDFKVFKQLAADEAIQAKIPLRVLLPGNIGWSKGAELIKAIKQKDTSGLIEFHVLGRCVAALQPWVVGHGTYEREQFSQLVADINPHIAAVLSIWPETFCHTLTESWACGLPVIGIEYGAVAERITRHGGGWLVAADVDAVYARLLDIRNNREERRRETECVREWQAGYGTENTTARMSEQYLNLYQTVLSNTRSLGKAGRKRIGFVMKGRFPNVPPTAYIRLVDWKEWFEQRYGGPVDFIHWSTVLRSELLAYSTVVVQRDAIPADRVAVVLGALQDHGVRLIFEIDDNLFAVPPDVDRNGTYAAYKEHFKQLCTSADEVHVTNKELQEVCSSYNGKILVRPNRLSTIRWTAPLDQKSPVNEGGAMSLDAINVLYFGSNTHAADLEFAIHAIELARKQGAKIQLHVVGITISAKHQHDFITVHRPPSSRYDKFVPWIRQLANDCDVGIAPLVDRQFAKTKSYIKPLEYMAMGLPVICSDGLPYAELLDQQQECRSYVLLLANDRYVWAQSLGEVMHLNEQRRAKIKRITGDFSISSELMPMNTSLCKSTGVLPNVTVR